ncbi:hypothetical protein KY334_01710 [Candidatus Woesearchaeota archaeon]|nr:hypothetical protein [Candidatus Woesearchaeota archaeon]
MQLGETFLLGNPENLMHLRKATVLDVFEMDIDEPLFEIVEHKILKGHNYKSSTVHSIN